MLKYFRYKAPFRKPFRTSLEEFEYREGIILSFEEDEIQAFGEVAPLSGFSRETFTQIETVLKQNKKFLENALINNDVDQIITVLDSIHQFPSLSFGLDSLKNDLQAKREKKTLSDFLFNKSSKPVTCNSTIGIQTIPETLRNIETKISIGFNTFKIKVGRDFAVEKETLNEIRSRFPDIKIRIDANQAWKQKEAINNLESLSDINIEYCEQPVLAQDIEGLKTVSTHSPIKIAADEAVGNKVQAKKLIEEHCCDIIIIKPALLGLFQTISVTKELAKTHDMEVIFTTTLDGIIGRTISAILASELGSKTYAHGLATGSLFNELGATPENIKLGNYYFPEVFGIGIPINVNFLEEVL